MTYPQLLTRFTHLKPHSSGHFARCPAHDDNRQSLSLTVKGTKKLLYCHAGCPTADVLRAVNLTWADLFDDADRAPRRTAMPPWVDIAAIRAVFEREYQRLYGQIMRKAEVEVVSWYLTATGEQPARSDWTLGQGDAGAPSRAARTRRSIYFAERRGFVDTPVFDRYALRPGARIAYWNLLVPRSRPESLADRIARDVGLGERLLARDRAFVYGGFQVETVLG